MRKKYILFLLTILLISLGVSCRKPHENEQISQEQASATQESDRGSGLGKGMKQKAVGRGFGQRALGKGGLRAWGPDAVIELSKEEIEMIKIQTVKVSYKPLRSQLTAMGKVLAHPLRKAIVSYAFPARISQIHIRIGDWVKKNQTLVTLQSEEVGNAKSDFYKAMADYKLSQVNFEREKSPNQNPRSRRYAGLPAKTQENTAHQHGVEREISEPHKEASESKTCSWQMLQAFRSDFPDWPTEHGNNVINGQQQQD